MSAHYDDPSFSYPHYWQHRSYEHEAEVIALETLLNRHHFSVIADIGGGYGRLVPTLLQYSSQVYLIEPSAKQRSIATRFFASDPKVQVFPGTAEKTGLPPSSVDLVTLIRVAHHLPNLNSSLLEAARIVRPGGFLILEFANSANFKARFSSFISGRSLPLAPIDMRSPKSIRAKSIPFVNHSPQVVLKQLLAHGFQAQTTLSVSNLRLPWFKKVIPLPILLILESILQPLLSRLWFGPSIFIMATRLDTPAIL